MNKSELIAAIAERADVSKTIAGATLDAFIETVIETVKKDKVQLIGFGTFECVKRAAREGRNPSTGEKIKIKASIVPKFKAGSGFKEVVNKGKK